MTAGRPDRPDDGAAAAIGRLLEVMARLRDPEGGCPWDLEQTFATIAPHTIEEAYEVADAIADGDTDGLRDELGDLLLHVVFHARMAEEEDLFDFAAVARAITDKMVRRHPHVFGDAVAKDADAVLRSWEEIKAREREGRERKDDGGVLDGIVRAAPALVRARKLQEAAAAAGFDWPDPEGALAKVGEEAGEVRAARADGGAVADEVGDLLFSVVNLARHLDVDPETALRGANERFRRRFRRIEKALERNGESLAGASLARMDELWEEAKAAEGDAPGADAARERRAG